MPEELDGAVVTNDFPLFDFDYSRLEPNYLKWLGRTHDFVQLCLRASEGTTNRVRLSEQRFLALAIPHPPIAEQRRAVSIIEQLHTKIIEAAALRQGAASEIDTLIANQELVLWPPTSLTDAPTLQSVTTYLSRGRQSEQGESDQNLIKLQHVQQDHYISTHLKLASYVAKEGSTGRDSRDGDIFIASSALPVLARCAL